MTPPNKSIIWKKTNLPNWSALLATLAKKRWSLYIYLTRLSFQNIILQNYSNTCDKYFLISLIPLFLLVRSTVFGQVENDQVLRPGLPNNARSLSITQCQVLGARRSSWLGRSWELHGDHIEIVTMTKNLCFYYFLCNIEVAWSCNWEVFNCPLQWPFSFSYEIS